MIMPILPSTGINVGPNAFFGLFVQEYLILNRNTFQASEVCTYYVRSTPFSRAGNVNSLVCWLYCT